ncbi:MAG: hypothetical protein AAGA40_13500 [Cyanobacteria bacterium P01_E01_bin.45]
MALTASVDTSRKTLSGSEFGTRNDYYASAPYTQSIYCRPIGRRAACPRSKLTGYARPFLAQPDVGIYSDESIGYGS